MLIGKNAVELIHYLLGQHPCISELTCVEYLPAQPLSTSMDSNLNEAQVLEHIRKRADHGGDPSYHRFSNADFKQCVSQTIDSLPAGRQLALLSRVQLADYSVAHIPMLDFKCKKNKENLEAICQRAAILGFGHGVLLATTNSYHYYGMQLLPENKLSEFLGQCLVKFCDKRGNQYSDERYVGHRLIAGLCTLRISGAHGWASPTIVRAVS